MSRWIDADALIEKIPTVMDMQDVYLPIHFKEWLIDEAPSIDIVRCKECKHWSGCKSTMHNNHRCSRAENVDYWTRADDFCSYGERKESE